jgi:type IV pilus assembly protein PilN
MRININLASQKYEAAGQFYLRWGTALALAVMVTLGLAFLAWSNYRNAGNDRRHITELQNKIAKLDQQQKQAQAVLNQPENQDVRDQKNFWNDVFDQRSFSWTQLISDLEKIMPARAYVISVQPTLTPERQLKLKLLIAGESHDNALELQRKMEGSERFHECSIKREGMRTQTQGAPGPAARSQAVWEFEIETFYTPASQVQQSPSLAKEGL